MFRLPDHPFSGDLQRARDELSTAWAHLVTAAGQVEHASRRRGALARDRAAAVRRAARGELPESPWRWLGFGLAAGVVLGAAATAALIRQARRDQSEAGPGDDTAAPLRGRATAAVHSASTAVHGAAAAAKGAAAAARDTVGKVRNKVGGDADPEASPPPATTEPNRPRS